VSRLTYFFGPFGSAANSATFLQIAGTDAELLTFSRDLIPLLFKLGIAGMLGGVPTGGGFGAFLVEEEAIDDAGGYVWIGALDLGLIAQSARPPSGGLAGRQPSFLPAHASPARTKKRGQALRSASSY
jgi:hypothetical protein